MHICTAAALSFMWQASWNKFHMGGGGGGKTSCEQSEYNGGLGA